MPETRRSVRARASAGAPPPCVLTIAGSDSGGGAGIQADQRTIHALGGFAATAITAITAQNTREVQSWKPVSSALLERQIDAVLEDLPIRAIKTGLLPGADAIAAVVRALRPYASWPLIVDPVIGSTSGTAFLRRAGISALQRDLLPYAELVTPNWPEAEVLTGLAVSDRRSAEVAGRELLRVTGCGAVLVKGGHGAGDDCEDVLVQARGATRVFRHRRIRTANTHGTGCVLSSAIATYRARGDALDESVRRAIQFLEKALRQGQRARWGGRGPALV